MPIQQWTRLLATNGGWPGRGVSVGMDGYVYVTGNTNGTLDSQASSGESDAFLTKFSPDGTKVWTKLQGSASSDYATSIANSVDGSIYVAGYTAGSLGGQSIGGSADAFLTKYGPDGTIVWTRLLGNSNFEDSLAVKTGLDGSIYVTGFTSGTLDGQAYAGGNEDAYLTKYIADGTKVWTRLLGTNQTDIATTLSVGIDGSVYVGGLTYSAIDGQPFNGGEDAFLVKYSSNGIKLWTRELGSSGEDRINATVLGPDGSIYACGYTTGMLDGQSNPSNYTSFLVKYGPDGTKLWTKLLGTAGYNATSIAIGPNGSIYLTGMTNGWVDGQPSNYSNDAFLVKYSSDGVKLSFTTFGTPQLDIAYSVSTSADGSIYIVGNTTGALNGQTYTGGGGDGAVFLVKYQPDDISAYALTSGATSVNEGSIATFTLTTTNVAAGTSVAYTVSGTGISRTDIAGGLLTGSVTVDSAGKGTISIPIATDQTTEGTETLIITAQGATASVQINDTSVFLVPTYVLTAPSSYTGEGQGDTFTLTTTNVAAGTSVPYTLSGAGITSGDIVGGQLNGSVIVDASGKASISILIAADGITEGSETLIITVGGASASIVINDTGVRISGGSGDEFLVNSGGSDTIDGGTGVDTVLYSSNRSAYSISSTTIVATFWNVTSLAEGTDQLWSVERLHFADQSLALDLGVTQASGQAALLLGAVLPGKLALDSSKQPLMGAVISLFDSGYSMVDLAGALLRLDIWTILTGQSVSASSRTLVEDTAIVKYLLSNVYGLTPDDVTLKANADVMHNEKSQGGWLAGLAGASAGQNHIGLQALAQKGLAYIAPESLSYGVSQVGGMGNDVLEGANLVFTLRTNLASGTLVPYALSGAGITTQDFSWAQSLSGNMTVGPYGEASMWVYTAMDKLTEGPETLVFTARGLSSSVMIQDTSQGPEQTIVLTPPSTAVNEGTFATFTLNTTNVTTGTIYAYSLSGTGISGSDFGGGQLSGSIAINAAGAATISIPIAADFVTEGPETLILTVAGKTASVVINDTAVAPVATYRLTAVGSSVNEGSSAIFNLATTYLPVGTSVPYTISGVGINSGDIYGAQLSGTVVITQNGTAVISVPTLADAFTEGTETLIVTVAGNSAQIVINDTSRGVPSYQLFPSALAVNVGDTLVVTLKTTNLVPGTVVPYILKGVPSTDIVGGLLSGDVVVDTSGVANINIAIAQHQTTDILTINVADQNIQVTLVGVKGG